MATIRFYRELVDTWPPDALVDGSITARSATSMTYTSAAGYVVTWTGTGLTYDSKGFGASGLVTGISVHKAGALYAEFTGVSVAMQRMSMLAFGYDRAPFLTRIASDSEKLFDHITRGADVITGSAYNDELSAGRGNDIIHALGGDDVVETDAGNDRIDGGIGEDTLSFETANWDISASHGFNLNTATGVLIDAWDGRDTVSGFETYYDSLYNDTLVGSDRSESFYLGRGVDQLNGGGGEDAVYFDRVDRWGASKGVSVNLTTGIVKDPWGNTDRVAGVEEVVGSVFNDTLVGSAEFEVFDGGMGVDRFSGGDGFDSLVFSMADIYVGGHGISVNMSYTTAEIRDDGFGKVEDFSGIERIYATNSADRFVGGTSAFTFYGEAGNDTMTGGGKDDDLNGGAGRDLISGGVGNDSLAGDSGYDTLSGGAGADVFFFAETLAGNGIDTFTDFQAGVDGMVIRLGWASGLLAPDLNAAQFRSGAGVTTANTATQRVIYNTTTGDVYFDSDGSASAASAVRIAVMTNHAALTYHDFHMS